jgi:hypothetical protein
VMSNKLEFKAAWIGLGTIPARPQLIGCSSVGTGIHASHPLTRSLNPPTYFSIAVQSYGVDHDDSNEIAIIRQKSGFLAPSFALLVLLTKVYEERINNLDGENRFWDGQIPVRGP